MLHGYDASELDKVVVLTVNRVLKITFINAIALLGYGAGYTIPEPSESVVVEECFICFVKNRNHNIHHLGMTFKSVIVFSYVTLFVPGASTGKSEPRSIYLFRDIV